MKNTFRKMSTYGVEGERNDLIISESFLII